MDWPLLVRGLGITVSLVGSIQLWRLRQRSRLHGHAVWLPATAVVLGIAADFFPFVVVVASLVLFQVAMAISDAMETFEGVSRRRRRKGLEATSGDEHVVREEIATELSKREAWAKGIHRGLSYRALKAKAAPSPPGAEGS